MSTPPPAVAAPEPLDLGTFIPVTNPSQLSIDAQRWFPGTNLVQLPQLTRLLHAAPIALRRRRIVAVDGLPGCGKSTAVAALAASISIETLQVSLRPKSTGLGLMLAFYEALTNEEHRGPTQRKVESDLKVLLAAHPRVVIFDEAQNVGLPALQALRFLLDLSSAKWALVLAGKGLLAMLAKEQMLDSRVSVRVTLPKLTGAALLETLRDLHPLYAAAPRELLMAIDLAGPRGNLREWTKFHEFATAMYPGEALSIEVAEGVLETAAGAHVTVQGHRR